MPNPNDLPEQLVARIDSADARAYASAAGWRRSTRVNGSIALYTHPSSDLDQLIIPLDDRVADYARRMAEVVANLSELEGRPAVAVLNDLLTPPSDVLRLILDEPDSESGYISLDRGIGLLAGAKKALLSSACSVIQPRAFHPRLSRSEAEHLVRSSLLGQTERGSFTAVISCPLKGPGTAASEATPLFDLLADGPPEKAAPDDLPFTRRVTSLLMLSVSRIASASDSDVSGSLLRDEAGVPRISANLCEALLMMQPTGDRSRLSLALSWSRSLPPPPGDPLPSVVHLRRDHFRTISSLALALRPNREPQSAHFVGLVDSLSGNPDVRGQVRGEVQLLIFNQEETLRARVDLDADDYRTAWEAHGSGGYVSLYGMLVRGERVHWIDRVSNFRSLRD